MLRRLLVRGHCDAYSGYGQLFLNMVRGLRDYGYDLVVRPTAIDEKYAPYPEDVKRLLWDREPMIQRELFIHLPRALYPNRKVVLWYTMWESTRLQSQWVEYIDSANAVIVPSTYNANVFSAKYVTNDTTNTLYLLAVTGTTAGNKPVYADSSISIKGGTITATTFSGNASTASAWKNGRDIIRYNDLPEGYYDRCDTGYMGEWHDPDRMYLV